MYISYIVYSMYIYIYTHNIYIYDVCLRVFGLPLPKTALVGLRGV